MPNRSRPSSERNHQNERPQTMTQSTVTYSPEDNKLRLYVGRVPRADYERLRGAGFVSTPKQDCDFVAVWTPGREDLAREFMDDDEDIGDEDYSPEERAADRAERFEGYRDKRRDEAHGHADTFEASPSVFGHQNQARAERQAVRHDRHRGRAVSQWSKAEYWQRRTAGVISHALHKASARVRRGRILTLEAEQRKHEKSRAEYAERFARWSEVPTRDGADQPVFPAPEGHYGIDSAKTSPAANLAYTLANSSGCYGDYAHPRTGREASIYSLMTDKADPITAAEAAALWLENAPDPSDPDTYSARWSAHYELRLTYENAMLANEGGMAGEAEMEIGGWIRGSSRRPNGTEWRQIHKINKSPATKRVTSVEVMGVHTGFTKESGYTESATRPCLVLVKMDRLGEDAYRAPTDAEREAFKAETAARKAEAQSNKKPAPSLINPTDADAEKLQAHWNARAAARHAKAKAAHEVYGDFTPSTIRRMTQAQYSDASKGSYAHCETVEIMEHGFRDQTGGWRNTSTGCTRDVDQSPVAFKIRKAFGGGNYSGQPDRVIVITDKPQKALPLDWSAITNPAAPTAPQEANTAEPALAEV